MEKSSYCRAVIAARVAEGHFSKDAIIHDDVESFEMKAVGKDVMGLTGGFPCQAGVVIMSHLHSPCCQGCSRAGKRKGLDDGRTSLLTHFFRLWDSAPWLFLVCSMYMWASMSNCVNNCQVYLMTYDIIKHCTKAAMQGSS